MQYQLQVSHSSAITVWKFFKRRSSWWTCAGKNVVLVWWSGKVHLSYSQKPLALAWSRAFDVELELGFDLLTTLLLHTGYMWNPPTDHLLTRWYVSGEEGEGTNNWSRSNPDLRAFWVSHLWTFFPSLPFVGCVLINKVPNCSLIFGIRLSYEQQRD